MSLVFDAELTARLLEQAPAAYRTQVNDLLLAGLARAVSRWSQHDEVVVELEGHGREDIFPGADISRTVGWFTTAFPVRLRDAGLDEASLIKEVKERLRAIPNRGLGHGVLRYLGSEQQRHALAHWRSRRSSSITWAGLTRALAPHIASPLHPRARVLRAAPRRPCADG